MRRQAVPDQQQRPVDLPLQRLQKLHDLLAGDGAFIETEVVPAQPVDATQALNQNFQFGTPTPTWYSLSSPECNDFAP